MRPGEKKMPQKQPDEEAEKAAAVAAKDKQQQQQQQLLHRSTLHRSGCPPFTQKRPPRQ